MATSARARHGYAALRLAAAGAAAGGELAGALLSGASWQVAASGAWCAAAAVFLVWVWAKIWDKDAAQTADHATVEDVSRATADLILLCASVASLVAVGFTLVEAGKAHGTTKALLILLAIATVALAWSSVHTVYTLRYGHLYYLPPTGGVDFNEDDPPDYHDFAYLALTIGMTYQVSDTDLQSKPVRRTAVRHALLSFLFGAVIVAITINVVASLLNK